MKKKPAVSRKRKLALMGKQVRVLITLHRRRNLDKREVKWETNYLLPEDQWVGWVTGFRTLQEGVSHPGGIYDQGYLDVKNTVPCALVAEWPDYTPRRVSPFGISTDLKGLKPRKVSSSWGETPYADADRWSLSRQPRKENGDFRGISSKEMTDLYDRPVVCRRCSEQVKTVRAREHAVKMHDTPEDIPWKDLRKLFED